VDASVRRASTTFAVLALVAAGAGCGVRGQSSAERIDSSDVPFDLLKRAPSLAREPGDTEAGRVVVYLLAAEHLVPVVRPVPHPASLATALDILAKGPTADEFVLGLRTAVGPTRPARSVASEEDLAVVELSDAFVTNGNDQMIGLAQMVFTLTEIPGSGRVQFRLGGQPIGVPRGDGVLTAEPVSRADYVSLTPRR
jgi:spore germination protein GerM